MLDEFPCLETHLWNGLFCSKYEPRTVHSQVITGNWSFLSWDRHILSIYEWSPLLAKRRSLIQRVYHMTFSPSLESLNNWFVHGSVTTDYPISPMRTPSLSATVHSSHWSPSLTQSTRQTVPIACNVHLGSLWNHGRASSPLSSFPHSLVSLPSLGPLSFYQPEAVMEPEGDRLCKDLNGGKRRPFGLPHWRVITQCPGRNLRKLCTFAKKIPLRRRTTSLL